MAIKHILLRFGFLSLVIFFGCNPLHNLKQLEIAAESKWFISEEEKVLKTNLANCEFQSAIENSMFIYRCSFGLGYLAYITIDKPGICEMIVKQKKECVAKLQDYALGEPRAFTKKDKEKIRAGLRNVAAFDSDFFYFIPAKVFILGYRTTPSKNMYNAEIPEEYEILIAKPDVSFHISGIMNKSDLKYIMQHLDYSKI